MNAPQLTIGVSIALSGMLATLLFASAAQAGLARWQPERVRGELQARIRSWWWIAGAFAFVAMLSREVTIALVAFTSFAALREYFSIIPMRRCDRRVLAWAYAAIPVQFLWAAIGWYGMFMVFIPVCLFLLLPMRTALNGETRGFLHAAGALHWGLMTCVFSLSHAAYLLALPAHVNPAGGNLGLLLYLALLTALNDVAQYCAGKLLGQRKVVPRVSPGKTVEGLLGGIAVTTALATTLAPLLTPFSPIESLGAGLLVALAGFLGDVVVSALKRDLGLKDSGTAIPGHGGVLDRVDSLTMTAPLFFHYLYYLHY